MILPSETLIRRIVSEVYQREKKMIGRPEDFFFSLGGQAAAGVVAVDGRA